jgi:hypothetical protein
MSEKNNTSAPVKKIAKKQRGKRCIHNRTRCKDCGLGRCQHGRNKYSCSDCGTGRCHHGRNKYSCLDCQCRHGHNKSSCRKCATQNREKKCQHAQDEKSCQECLALRRKKLREMEEQLMMEEILTNLKIPEYIGG